MDLLSPLKEFGFLTNCRVCLQSACVDDIIRDAKDKIMESFENFESQGLD